jgi:hypothetical protein
MSLTTSRALEVQSDALAIHFGPPPPSTRLTSPARRPAATSSPFSYGMDSATAYSSSASIAMSAYTELPGHHLLSTLDLLVTMPASTYADFVEDSDSWAGADFSRLRDPEALCRFLATSNYCFSYSYFDEGSYDPSCECFHIEIEEVAQEGSRSHRAR